MGGGEINKQHTVMQHLQPVSLRPREAAQHTCGTLPDVSVCSMRGLKPIIRRADKNASPAKVRLYSFGVQTATERNTTNSMHYTPPPHTQTLILTPGSTLHGAAWMREWNGRQRRHAEFSALTLLQHSRLSQKNKHPASEHITHHCRGQNTHKWSDDSGSAHHTW